MAEHQNSYSKIQSFTSVRLASKALMNLPTITILVYLSSKLKNLKLHFPPTTKLYSLSKRQ